MTGSFYIFLGVRKNRDYETLKKEAASQAPAPPKIEIMIHLASGFLKPIFETKVFHGKAILPTNRATRRRAAIVNQNKLCHLKRAISNPLEIRKKT